jgi:S-DNA-T family DNA segregation ATPase FtsK/SpoIIIE
MRMATEDDYSMLGVPVDVLDQHSPPGRALDDGREIQVAVLGGDADVVTQAAQIDEFAAALREIGTQEAPPIRSLPDVVPLASLGGSAEGGVPLGLESAGLAPFAVEARSCFLVTGPPSSGRSTALRSLVESTRRFLHGAELHYLGHRRSDLAAWDGWHSRSLTPDEIASTAEALAAALPLRPSGSARVVVVLESAGDLVSGPADMALQTLAKVCIAEEQWFVVEGEVSTLRTTMGFLGVVKSSRRGLALQPDQETGSALFNTPFPRVNRNDFPPGRAFLVGSGRASLVQVATTQGSGG